MPRLIFRFLALARSVSSPSSSVLSRMALAGLLLAGAAGLAAPASADILVSNIGKARNASRTPSSASPIGQVFNTGDNANGYNLESVNLNFNEKPSSGTPTVTLREDNSGSPSDTVLYTFTNPTLEDGLNKFSAPSGAILNAETEYWIVVSHSGGSGGPSWDRVRLNAGIDDGAAAGWDIDGAYKVNTPSGWTVGSSTRAMKIQVEGTASSVGDAAPLVTSIERQEPSSSSPTNADSLTWRVTFNENVKNVNAADFTVSGTSATLTISEVTASTVYDVTASGGDLASLNATATLGFSGSQDIKDTADNALANTTPTVTNDNTYVVDNTAPEVAAIERQTPSSSPTNADSLKWHVTFNEPVKNVDEADFTVSGSASPALNASQVNNTGTLYQVSAFGNVIKSLNATVTLGFSNNQDIKDTADNDLSNTEPTGTNDNTYVVDNTAPGVTSIVRQTPSSSPTNADSLTWRVTFNENVQNLNAADFTVSGTSATLTVNEVTASTVYDVTASGGDLASLNATATLGFSGSQDIKDTADNALANTTPTGANDNTYVVDNTRPSVTITGVPATSSAAFSATFSFSEPVTGFAVEDVIVGNGAASAFSVTTADEVWTALITPTASGTVTVDVAAGVAVDAAGNDNTAATRASSTYTAPVASVSVSPTSLSVNEGGTTTYTVVLTTEPSGTVTVTPSSDDTGAATLSPASLTFTSSNWDTAQTVTVSGEEDDDANNETVTVSHSVSGYSGVTTAADVSVTVSDNDTAGVSISPTSLSVDESGTTTYTVVLNTDPSGSVTVTPSSGDTDVATLNPASLTFTSSNWNTAQTVTVSGEEDDDANDETVTVSHSVSGYSGVTTAADVSVTVSDNDTAGVSVSPTSLSVDESGTTTYTVVLDTEPSSSVTVTPSSNDTGAATFSPSGLTFTSSNWNTAQTVTVSGEEDDDANDETVTVSHSVSGYDSVSTADDVSVTVTDNDTAGVSVSPTSLSVDESGTTTYTVVLDAEPSGSVTVTPSSNDTGAATLSPSGLTFTSSNWNTAQTVTVSGEEDDDANNETVTVSHSVSGYDSVSTADDVSVTVTDDDTAGVSVSPTSLSVNEGGTTTYTVVLDTEPNSSVTVTPSSDDTGAATLSPASLTFTSSNWDTAQTITVSGEEDVNSDDETVTVSHSVSGYGAVTTADSVSVTVSDNDTPGVNVSPTSLSVDESGTTTYSVVLNTDPSGSVTVTPSSGDTDVATLNPASLTFTSSNWDTAQTVTVSGEEDDDANDETVTVSHSVSGYSGVTTAADVGVTVTDNDTAGVSVSPTSLSVDESGTTTYTVVLDTEPSGSVTVTPSSGDTDVATLNPASLTFTSSNWSTAQTVTVSGEEDDDANDETVTVSHSVSGYSGVTTVADVSVTVTDNDTAGVSVSPTSLSVDESGTTTYTVVLDTEPSGSVTVTPSSNDTGAATLSPSGLTFTSSNWNTAQTVTVSGEEDDDANDETVTVSHSVSGYDSVTTADDVSVTVTDDDTAGVSVSPTSLSVNEGGTTTYTVVLDTEPNSSVTVTPSSGDTDVATLSPASLTFTSSNWDTAQTITVSGEEDVNSDDETVTVSHSVSGYGAVTTADSVSVTVSDNDTPGVNVSPTRLSVDESGTTTYSVMLNTEPNGSVTVTPSSADTGAATLSPASLTFTSSNWDTAQTITVSGEEDDDANDETVTVSHSVSGYSGVTTADDVSVTVTDNDTAGVSVSPTSLSVDESGTTTYTVVLDTEPNGSVTVTPSSDDTGAATFSPSGLTFTSSNWSTAQTVTVSGEEDDDANDETVTVSHSVSGYSGVTTAADVSVTVSDNDTAGVSVSPTSLSVDESGTTTYTVVLTAEPNGSVTVTPSSDDTGAATLSPASLTFTSSNWDTAQTVTVSGEEDDDANNETVTVSHSVSGYDSVTTADDVSVTVSDNDTAGVSISPTSLSVDESGTTTYTVVLTAEPNGSVTVTPSSDDTGEATLSPSGLTFTSSNWDTAQTITVSGEEDDDANDETVTVSHSVSGYSGVTTADDVSVTVTDNDTAGVSVSPTSLSVDESGTTTYTVVLNTEPNGSVTITPSSADTGAATFSPSRLTFSSVNWDTAQTVTVSGEEDDDANDETVTVSHSVSGYDSVTTADDVSVTVSDNDTAGVSISPTSLSVDESGTTTYTVVLETEPNAPVTVTPSSDDTGVATLSPASLTFTSSNWSTAQTVTVSGEDDDDDNDETVTVSHSVSGYSGVTTAADVSVTVSDNDTAGVSVSPTTLTVEEEGTATYTVVLETEPDAPVTVTPSSDDTGAATLSPASLTFSSSNWDTAQTVTVSGEEDDDANDETVTVSHSVSGYDSVSTADDVSVTVSDSDAPGVRVSPTTLSVEEDGITTYTVVLKTEPNGPVTVTPSSGDTDAAMLSPASLTFSSSNWSTAQTVTVSGEEDPDADDEIVTVSHSVSGYGGVTTVADVSVTVNDNDTPGVSVSPTTLTVEENGTTTYTVVLNTEPSGTVTVTPSSGDTAAATLSPASLTFSSSNWATAQTVTVSGEEDDDADDEIVTVSHSVSGYVGVTTAANVSVTVTDNDTIDAANPQVTSIERLTPPSSPTNADSLTWRVTFNKDVKNVDAADFTVSSATATVTVSEVTAATVYDVTASDGDLALLNATVTFGFSDGQDIQDMDDSALITAPTGANETTYVLDNIQPSVTITGVPATSAASFSATFSFSEPVTGFAVEDVIVGNGAASAFSVTTADEVWTALITPTASGTVTVDVAAGVAVDAAGNDNTAATRASSTYTSASVAPPSDRDPDATRERAVPLPVVNPPQEEPYLHVQGGSLDPATGDVIDYYSFTMTTSQTSQGAVQLQRLAATRNGAFPLNNAQQVDIQVEVKEGQNTGLTVTLEDDKANNLQMVSLEAGQRSVQIEASLEPGTYYIKVQIQEEVTDSTPTPSAPVEYDLSLSLEPPSPPAGAVTDAQAEEVATAFNPWLARFGRTVTDQVLETVKQRLQPGRQEGAQVRIAGQDIPLAIAPYIGAPADQEEQPVLQSWLLSWRPSPQDWVTGSSFALTTNPDPGASDGGYLSFWGQGAIAGFDGRQDQLSLEGQVTTTLVGADWVTGQWTAGVTLGRSTGAGDYRQSDCAAADPCSIAVETTLTGVYPYLGGVQLGDHVEAWAAAGYGRGDLTLRPDDDKALSTDLTVTMGAAGLHSQLLQPANGDGFSVAFKGDARFTRATSEAVNRAEGNLAAAEADVWLIRAGIEAARPMALGAAATFIPSFEVGVRLDGGDADTGFGTDIGAGLAFSSPQKGLRLDLKARGLMAHEAAGFQEWGAAASLTWEPQPDSEHGLSAGLTQSWGASPSGGMEALLQRRSMAELAATDDNDVKPPASWQPAAWKRNWATAFPCGTALLP